MRYEPEKALEELTKQIDRLADKKPMLEDTLARLKRFNAESLARQREWKKKDH